MAEMSTAEAVTESPIHQPKQKIEGIGNKSSTRESHPHILKMSAGAMPEEILVCAIYTL